MTVHTPCGSYKLKVSVLLVIAILSTFASPVHAQIYKQLTLQNGIFKNVHMFRQSLGPTY